MYTGKELESKEAKWKRYRLKEKVLYGGVEEGEAFGEKLYLKGEGRLKIGGARHLLFIGNGARWINEIAGGRLLEERLPTRLVALPEEVKRGPEGRRESD
jgi:hypothetical protein